MNRYLTVAELAAILGMSRAGVRQIISRRQIKRRGKGDYGANLYDPHDILNHAGGQDRRSPRPERTCEMLGCVEPHMARGYCTTHYQRWRRHGDPEVVLGVGTQTPGGYESVHTYLRQLRGPAVDHSCVCCGQQAHDWTYDHQDEHAQRDGSLVYSLDPEHYQPMCRSCHKTFDLPSLSSL